MFSHIAIMMVETYESLNIWVRPPCFMSCVSTHTYSNRYMFYIVQQYVFIVKTSRILWRIQDELNSNRSQTLTYVEHNKFILNDKSKTFINES